MFKSGCVVKDLATLVLSGELQSVFTLVEGIVQALVVVVDLKKFCALLIKTIHA
jgi:hypothetical protein